jgi:hypothetical protein
MVHNGHMNAVRVPVPTQLPLSRADLCGQFDALDGRRAVAVNESGPHRNLRAVGGLYEAGGHVWVDLVTDGDWWAQRLTGGGLRRTPWPAGAVWVE